MIGDCERERISAVGVQRDRRVRECTPRLRLQRLRLDERVLLPSGVAPSKDPGLGKGSALAKRGTDVNRQIARVVYKRHVVFSYVRAAGCAVRTAPWSDLAAKVAAQATAHNPILDKPNDVSRAAGLV